MVMKAAVISLGSKSSKWTAKAMKNYFRTVDELNIKDIEVQLGGKEPVILHKGKPMEEYDCIYAKGSFRYAALLRSITSIIGHKTYVPIEESAFTTVHDKLLTQLKLQQSGIPMPTTYLSATPDAGKKVLEKMNYPVIMKFPQGTQGKGVMFAESYAAASSMLDALTALKQPFLIQEYIETSGVDTRIIVVGEEIVASMKRIASGDEKRSNLHAGGKAEVYQPDAYTKKIAIETAKAIGAHVCGVDILESIKGPVVLEANISPGLQGITEVTKIDIPEKIAKFLSKKTKEFMESKKTTGAKKIMQEVSSAGKEKEIITNVDFRSNRILIPQVISQESKIKDTDDAVFKVKEGKIIIEKFEVK